MKSIINTCHICFQKIKRSKKRKKSTCFDCKMRLIKIRARLFKKMNRPSLDVIKKAELNKEK